MRLCFLLTCWVGLAGGFVITNSVSQAASPASATTIYKTSFEQLEGFDPKFTLVGQDEWVGFGSGGNGMVTNFFEGFGQQAFIGFTPPETTNLVFNVWRPIDLAPINPNEPLVTFSVLMQIIASTSGNTGADDFRWSVYNTNGSKLFTIDFDNKNHAISYALDDNRDFVATGFNFQNSVVYELIVAMDFVRNLWTASLNGRIIVNSQPITTAGAPLNLGDIDAVWAIRQPGAPGDNYMLFDEYEIVSESLSSIPATIEMLGFGTNNLFKIRVFGQQDLRYSLEGSTNLLSWQQVKAFTAPVGGVFEFEDADATTLGQRYYRAVQIP